MVEMDHACPAPSPAVSYAYCRLDSRLEEEVPCILTHEEGISLFCNGEIIYSSEGLTGKANGEKEITLPLKEGHNHILLKVGCRSSKGTYAFKLEGKEIRNHKQKYYIQ
jgi:hypothetical protein